MGWFACIQNGPLKNLLGEVATPLSSGSGVLIGRVKARRDPPPAHRGHLSPLRGAPTEVLPPPPLFNILPSVKVSPPPLPHRSALCLPPPGMRLMGISWRGAGFRNSRHLWAAWGRWARDAGRKRGYLTHPPHTSNYPPPPPNETPRPSSPDGGGRGTARCVPPAYPLHSFTPRFRFLSSFLSVRFSVFALS